MSAPVAPTVSADERRRQLRAEKDGEAQAERTPAYEGAASAATALPSQEDAPSVDSSPTASPPPPPPPPPPPG